MRYTNLRFIIIIIILQDVFVLLGPAKEQIMFNANSIEKHSLICTLIPEAINLATQRLLSIILQSASSTVHYKLLYTCTCKTDIKSDLKIQKITKSLKGTWQLWVYNLRQPSAVRQQMHFGVKDTQYRQDTTRTHRHTHTTIHIVPVAPNSVLCTGTSYLQAWTGFSSPGVLNNLWQTYFKCVCSETNFSDKQEGLTFVS